MCLLELVIVCSVLFEIVAAVFGRLKFDGFSSLLLCKKVILLMFVGVFTVFFVIEVSCLLILLFLPSNCPISDVKYKFLWMFEPFYTFKVNLISYYGPILSLISIVKVLIKKFYEEGLIDGGNNFLIGMERSCLPSYFSVFALHGVFPVSIS